MSKTVYALLVLFLNSWGITSFLNGNIKKGIFTILSSWITCSVVGIINAIKGIILAISIFKMTDDEFAAADRASLESVIAFFC